MNKIKELRENKRVSFSQYHLAALSGIAQNRISLIERGLVIPSEKEIEAIAKALGYEVKDIFQIKKS